MARVGCDGEVNMALGQGLTFASARMRGSLSCILPAVSIKTTSNLFSLATP